MTTPLEVRLRMAKAQYATIEMALHSLHLYREIPTEAHHSFNHVGEVLMNDLIINWHSIFCKANTNKISFTKNNFNHDDLGKFDVSIMLQDLGLTTHEWGEIKKAVSTSRNRYVAHVDIDVEDAVPKLKLQPLEDTLFYYRNWLVKTINLHTPKPLLDKSIIYDNATLSSLLKESKQHIRKSF
ncbi:hypothetical protein [Vibrio sp. MED222]|uniref:hypothetical protein n=1 Tax=Vibrio sp. MED222 TaxID=314290 RepID=UPI0003262B1F|nr:hypothetical protein [Vibrio sp. MED222]